MPLLDYNAVVIIPADIDIKLSIKNSRAIDTFHMGYAIRSSSPYEVMNLVLPQNINLRLWPVGKYWPL